MISGSGGGAAGSFGDQFKGNMPGGVVSLAGNSGHAEGTTQAAVANGTLTIRDRDNQKQDVANLSRDTEHANDSISPIFDKEKEQKRLQTVQAISDIGGQVADIARTQGEIIATKDANEKMQGVSPEERDAARAQWQKENPGKGEYENTGNYNSKASQQYADAYGQIVNLLNITSVDAQNQQQVKDALTQYAMDVLGVDRQTAQIMPKPSRAWILSLLL